MTNDTIRQGQNHTWMRSHRDHAHAMQADLIACDEDLAYAIDGGDYDTVVARDLRIGMVVRWDEYTDLTVMDIQDFDNGRQLMIRFAGDLHPSTGLDETGRALAGLGRPFQVYNG